MSLMDMAAANIMEQAEAVPLMVQVQIPVLQALLITEQGAATVDQAEVISLVQVPVVHLF